jgi:hypothetical protein
MSARPAEGGGEERAPRVTVRVYDERSVVTLSVGSIAGFAVV